MGRAPQAECALLDALVAPVGGGGLVSGVGLAMKAVSPGARVIGVEVEASTPFTVSLARGAITQIRPRPTLADGLAGNLEPGSITFPLVQRVVDEIVTVGEEALIAAMRALWAKDDASILMESPHGTGPLATREAVARLTPARSATSLRLAISLGWSVARGGHASCFGGRKHPSCPPGAS